MSSSSVWRGRTPCRVKYTEDALGRVAGNDYALSCFMLYSSPYLVPREPKRYIYVRIGYSCLVVRLFWCQLNQWCHEDKIPEKAPANDEPF